MKYTKKIPNTDMDLSKELLLTGWKKIKAPSSTFSASLFSIPFLIINSVLFMIIAVHLYPSLKDFFNDSYFDITLNINFTTLFEIASIFLFMTVHEFVHICFIPNFLKSDKVYWGINFMFGFCYTTEKIKKDRYILISIMPFILLSIILPIILSILGLLNEFILFLCLTNAMGSCVDCLNIWIILNQVPNDSYIINNGFETYYKTNE